MLDGRVIATECAASLRGGPRLTSTGVLQASPPKAGLSGIQTLPAAAYLEDAYGSFAKSLTLL